MANGRMASFSQPLSADMTHEWRPPARPRIQFHADDAKRLDIADAYISRRSRSARSATHILRQLDGLALADDLFSSIYECPCCCRRRRATHANIISPCRLASIFRCRHRWAKISSLRLMAYAAACMSMSPLAEARRRILPRQTMRTFFATCSLSSFYRKPT